MDKEGRLRRIERKLNSRKACPVCGHGYPDRKIKVEWRTYGDPEREPEYCPACGRQTVIVLRWRTDEEE